jgi:brefeldin A-inhibited guanine nucleotide-exchange protein
VLRLQKEIEVLLNEIFLPILEMRTSTIRQKSILLAVMARLCRDPRALVELYLNYDCDRSSIENIYERLVNILAKMSTTHYSSVTPANEKAQAKAAEDKSGQVDLLLNPALLSGSFGLPSDASQEYNHMPIEQRIRRQSLEALVVVLKSLVLWAGKGGIPAAGAGTGSPTNGSQELLNASVGPDAVRRSEDPRVSTGDVEPLATSGVSTPDPSMDDPTRFENAKQRKTTLIEGIKKFNFKPKRGIKFLLDTGFIKSSSPQDIARFLLHGDGFNKAALGEYLGEG